MNNLIVKTEYQDDKIIIVSKTVSHLDMYSDEISFARNLRHIAYSSFTHTEKVTTMT